ncbi:MAG: FecR domain-containing protein [Polyangiaceae bacterium]|nr:FecR domain-containing protein [Polyangiaceae bacterium]
MADRDLADLGRELPWDEPDAERVEQVRTALLTKAPKPQEPRPPRRRYHWLLLAAAVVCGIALFWPRTDAVPPRNVATLHPGAGARFTRVGTPGDDIVRLTDGELTVEVLHLELGERFRVITGDAEVEVRGTAFDVRVEHDALRSVRVLHGRVEVRHAGHPAVILAAGESWRSAAETPRTDVAPPAASVAPPTARPAAATPSAVSVARRYRGEPTIKGQEAAPAPVPAVEPTPQASSAQKGDEAAFREGYDALRTGDNGRAEQAFAKASRSGTLAEDATYWRAVSLMRGGHRDAATRAFQEFLVRFPESPRRGEASAMLGKLLLAAGDSDAARKHFQAATEDSRPDVRKAAEDALKKLP